MCVWRMFALHREDESLQDQSWCPWNPLPHPRLRPPVVLLIISEMSTTSKMSAVVSRFQRCPKISAVLLRFLNDFEDVCCGAEISQQRPKICAVLPSAGMGVVAKKTTTTTMMMMSTTMLMMKMTTMMVMMTRMRAREVESSVRRSRLETRPAVKPRD